jgi:histidinol dehydrogenase
MPVSIESSLRCLDATSLAFLSAIEALWLAVPNLTAAVTLSNRLAPEHLELAVAEPHALLDQISAAGAIFMGAMSSESLGRLLCWPQSRAANFGLSTLCVAIGGL